jgi:hypothetical protein
VYSKAEIARLLAAAPVCQVSRRCTIGSSTLSAIILFLYGTGLRVTEALSLNDSNTDFRNGLIDICPGSVYRHRTIPIGSDVQRVLLRHLRSPERASFGTGKALFLTRKRSPFRANSSLPPRLQDLRHTSAVNSIAGWSQAGWSCEKMLPMLTAYMGNVREKGFLRYFELTPSRYRAQLACLDIRTIAPELARCDTTCRGSQWYRNELKSFSKSENSRVAGSDVFWQRTNPSRKL